MKRWQKITLMTISVIVGLMLLSMLVVPWQIKKQGNQWFAENTTRTLNIEKVFFNPFTLTVEVEGVQLSEQESAQTFVSLARLRLSGSVRSLIDWSVILDRVELDELFVNIELLGKQEFNFSDFTRLGGAPAEEPAVVEDAGPIYFSLNNIVLNDGKIDFTDRTSPKNSQHQIRELSLSIPFVGNIPYLTDEYVEPQLRMLLNGSEVNALGQLKPFHESLETSLTLILDAIDLAYYAYHSPVPLPLDVKSGILDTQIDLLYRVSSTEEPKLLLGGELALTDIDLRDLEGRDLFRLPTLILDLGWANLLQQDFNLLSLEIYEPEIFLSRDKSGTINFLQLLPASPTPEVAVEPQRVEPVSMPLLKVEQLLLEDGQIHYRDEYPLGGFKEDIKGINLELTNLSTHWDDLTELAFSLQSSRDMSFSLNGQLGLNPLSAELSLILNGLQLEPHYPFLADLLTRPLAGDLNLATTVQFGPKISLKLEQLQLTLHQLKVPFTDQDYFSLQDLMVTGGLFDLDQQLLKFGNIKFSKGSLLASRTAEGKLSPLALLRDKGNSEAEPSSAEPLTVPLPWQKKAAQVELDKFKLQLNEVALEQFKLQFTDASLAKHPQLNIAQLNLNLTGLTYPESQQSPFKVNAQLGKGTVALSGKVAHSPIRVQGQTQIKALPLAEFNDFLPDNVKVSLEDGKLFTNMSFKLTEQPEVFAGHFTGRVNISDFNLRDPLNEGELLTWQSLDLVGIKGELAPFKLYVKEVSLSDYLAKIQIDQQGRVNLARVTSTEAAETAAVEGDAAITAAEPAATGMEPAKADLVQAEGEAAAPADIRIDAVTLQGGTVSFTDRHLPSIFSATMYELGGRVTGLASDEQMQADVDLRGQLENHSPLTISGKLNPLSKDLYADLTIRFKDIDLAPMTPYSGTYLGYVIDKGKLYLDLSYHIERQQIKADNKIMIDQFTFGDSVASDKATSLPVGLAIALLKDSNDEIHLDVPISGDLSDPEFSIIGAVLTILKNLLVKAATAPFSLLAGMLGGGDEDFTSLSFASGIARLDAKQAEMLGKLAEMLAKRPSITLEISAFADQEKDPEGFRQDQLQLLLQESKFAQLNEQGQAPESPEQVEVSPDEYPQYLLQVYKNSDFPRPRNFVGMLKSLPDEEMKKLLLAHIRAEDEQLQALANARALAVRDALLAVNEEIKPRIFLKTVDIYQLPEKGAASRVEFNISSK